MEKKCTNEKHDWVKPKTAWTRVVEVTRNSTISEEELARKLKKILKYLE